MSWPGRVCIVGLGLMGGSLALAIRHLRPGVHLHGVDREAHTRHEALERNVVHAAFEALEPAVEGCDLVVLAVPVDAIVEVLPQLRGLVGPQAIVSDMGSTKTRICEAGRVALGARFVGGHPFTGAEHSGLNAADPFLFENALYALTCDDPDEERARLLKHFLESLGAQVVFLPPPEHDRIVAHVSHLPQLLATTLCDQVRTQSQTNPLYRELAAGGFRDLTRVAASPYALWGSILRDNRTAVDAALAALQAQLQQVRNELQQGTLEQRFERAASFRRQLPWRSKGLLKPLQRIALVIEDRPGELVKVLQVLLEQRINLKDIELRKTREGDGSTFHLYVESASAAQRGAQALQQRGWEAQQVA